MPEQAFSSNDSLVQGISAVKALALAAAQGQRVWTITQDNLNEALTAINLDSEIENEIRNAVLAGKVATAHEQPINFSGVTSAGYILLDPETGGGAYLISGGESGAILIMFGLALLYMAGLSLFLGAVGILAFGALIAVGLASISFGISLLARAMGNSSVSDFFCSAGFVFIGTAISIMVGGLVAFYAALSSIAGIATGVVVDVLWNLGSLFAC